MKKFLIVLSAALFALVACQNEAFIVEEGPIDASKLVFNVQVNYPDATKAVKTNWTDGDKVYLFFEDNTTTYAWLTRSGSTWTSNTSGELSNLASGKKVTAVFLPFNTDTPTYDSGWKFETKYAFYLKAEGVEYAVATDPSTGISTVSVSLNMAAPAGFVQFFLPDAEPVANKYVLIEEHIIPAGCGIITPGGAVEQVTRLRASEMAVYTERVYGVTPIVNNYSLTPVANTSGYPMEAMIISGEGGGYYFYGTIASAVSNPTFYLVEQNPTYKFAIGTQTKTYTGKTLSAGAAIKFGAFGAQERWVDLNLPNGVKWATGNVYNSGMVTPTQIGQYYPWGETVGLTPDAEGKFSRPFHLDDYSFFSRWATPEEMTASGRQGVAPAADYDAWFTKYYKGYHITLEPSKEQKAGDDRTRLEPEDDAATQNIGEDWRMPTHKEWCELVLNGSTLWKNNKRNYLAGGGPQDFIDDGVIRGLIYRRNGLSLFLPAGYHGTAGKLKTDGSDVCYWSSDLYQNGSYLQANGISVSAVNVANEAAGTFNNAPMRRNALLVRAVYDPEP